MIRALLLLTVTLPVLSAETLSLDTAIDRALIDNPGYRAAEERLRQAEARWRQARAENLPTLRLEAAGRQTEYSDRALADSPFLENSSESFSAGVQSSWLLFNARRGHTVRAAKENVAVAEALERDGRLQLISAVARNYHQIQLALENIRIAKGDSEFNQRLVNEAEKRMDAGKGSYADYLNFRIRLNAARASQAALQVDLDSARAGFAALLNLEDDQDLDVEMLSEESSQGEPFHWDASWAYAQTNLPVLAAQRALLATAEANRKAARGEYAPELRLAGGLTAERNDDPDFDSDDVGSTVGVTMNLSLWDGGARRTRLREATAVRDEQELLLRQAELDARTELRSAASALRSATETRSLQKQNLELTRENRDLIEKAYKAGAESLIRLNEAQRDYITAQGQVALSSIQVRNARVRLKQATGELLRD